jgi:hypothetical protein
MLTKMEGAIQLHHTNHVLQNNSRISCKFLQFLYLRRGFTLITCQAEAMCWQKTIQRMIYSQSLLYGSVTRFWIINFIMDCGTLEWQAASQTNFLPLSDLCKEKLLLLFHVHYSSYAISSQNSLSFLSMR